MQNLFRKLAYVLLTLSIVNIPIQAFYISSSNCDEMQMEMAKQENGSHCFSQKSNEPCSCDNCKCDMCITIQASIQSIPQVVSQYQVTTDMPTAVISSHYTQHYHNPLLRPPIA